MIIENEKLLMPYKGRYIMEAVKYPLYPKIELSILNAGKVSYNIRCSAKNHSLHDTTPLASIKTAYTILSISTPLGLRGSQVEHLSRLTM